ncbi:MAG: hypothetical protein RLZZ353_830 [Actinomycetota bacterium]
MRRIRLLPGVLVGGIVGVGIAVLAGAGSAGWRGPVVGAGAGLLVAGLRRIVRLAGLEWRREAPTVRAYLGAVGPVLAALVLVGIATT